MTHPYLIQYREANIPAWKQADLKESAPMLCPTPGGQRLEYKDSHHTDIRPTLTRARIAANWPEVAR